MPPRRTTSASTSTGSRRRTKEEDEEPSAKPSARSTATRTRTTTATSSRTSKAKASKTVEEDEEEGVGGAHDDDDEDEEEKPVSRSRTKPSSKVTTSKPRTKASAKRIVESEEEESDVAEFLEEASNADSDDGTETMPSSKRRTNRPAVTKPKSKDATKKSTKGREKENGGEKADQKPTVEDDDDDLDSFLEPPKVNRRSASTASAKPISSRSQSKPLSTISSKPRASIPPSVKEEPKEEDQVNSTAPSNAGVTEESSEEEDLLAAVRNVPATPAAGRRGMTVPPSMRRSGVTDIPPTPGLNLNPPQLEEPKGPQARLVIHQMALVNFKSYAGRQEIGPFHKSFSAIVGPNGSGKSNTIDALLFVFGYRASKMRQGKLSELIHNSADYPDLQECRVEVHFREIIDLPGPDAYKVVPGSNLIVARSAYRNNSSKYTINGNPSSFTEVTTLLKDRGIDLDHKRFLILQGEVESIAQMKPKASNEHEDGLLEYLEDIIGTSKYKEPIEQALAQVDTLNEDRAEKLNRLRLVEKDKAGLEEKKKEAEAYLRNKNELVRAQNKLYQYYLYGHLRQEADLNEANEALTVKLQEEIDKNADNVAENDRLHAEYDERVKAFEVIKKETTPLVKQLQNLEKQEVQLGEKKKHVMAKGKKLAKSLKEDMHAKNEADQWIENHSEQLEKSKAEIDQLEANLVKEEAELDKIRDSLKDKTEVFHAQIVAKQKELEPWTAKVNKKQAEIDLATNERNMLAEKAEAVQNAVDEAVKTVESLMTDKEAKIAELRSLEEEKENVQAELSSCDKKLKNIEEQERKHRSKLMGARQKADEAKASQAASTSQNAVLDNLKKLKATGRIKGFHGRLGDLGTIPDKYDIAISTACSALNYLVVDEVAQGQACLDYLRQQNIGRANIFVLEKLPSTIPAVQTPENAPRLFDLIKPKDPKFAPAFYKAIRDTLVANDLEQANRIAFGGQRRWRVVTLTGQLIDVSGTMSGGGTKVSKGLMSSKFAAEAVRPEVVRQYEKDSEEAEQGLAQFLEEKRTFLDQMEELKKKLPKIDMSISKVQLDIQTGEKRIAEAKKRVKELQSQSKPDAGDVRRISQLDAEIATATKELDKIQKSASAIESEIQSLQNKILDIGGVRMRSQKSKVDGIKEMIDLANEQLTKAEVGKSKSEKDSERLTAAIASSEKQLEELKEELDELESVLAACLEDMNGLKEKVELAQEVAEKHSQELEEMKAELDERKALINKFREREMKIRQKVDTNNAALADERRSIKQIKIHLEKLELDDVDEDDEDEAGNPEATDAATPANKTDDGSETPTERVKREGTAETEKPDPLELKSYTEEELERMNEPSLKGEVAKYEGLLKEAQPNMKALEEYRKREAEFLKRAKDLEEVTDARDGQKRRYDELRKSRLDEFMSGFNTISSKLKEMYQMITLGGNAELELVDSMDPFSEGIIFSVMPPKKSWKNISNLSGGEKTLSSLALVFALHVFKPTPLYFMDEIDAALDFRNVSIVANYIKDRTKNAQFIIISLRNDMFELSHRLIGIYKTSNATRSISIDNKPLNTVPQS